VWSQVRNTNSLVQYSAAGIITQYHSYELVVLDKLDNNHLGNTIT